MLHEKGWVHRDIKPENVFFTDGGQFVLGDFGIVFFDDREHTRVSGTFENIGSRDWMPPWAMAVRIEEVTPTFDVFSLGKVLWSCLSGVPKLPLWYFRKDKYNLEKLFPDDPRMPLINDLLAKCLVEDESTSFPDAGRLLVEVNALTEQLTAGGQKLGIDIERKCRSCARGLYRLEVDKDISSRKTLD